MFTYIDNQIQFHHSIDYKPDSSGFPLSAHKSHEIFYFISGKGSYLVEGNVYKLQPGCVMIMRGGEFHKLLIEPDVPYERMALHFNSSLFSEIDPEGLLLKAFTHRRLGVGNLFTAGEISIGHIYECLKSIDAAPEDDYLRRLAILSNLYSILYEIRIANMQREKSPLEQSGKTNSINELIAYINANLSGELSLDVLSERFFISKNHLNRIFKAATGTTIWEYIRLKRLLFARESILAGSSAAQACQNSGFRDYSSFYRAYVERFGVSPKSKTQK